MILDLIFPKICQCCGEVGSYICDSCIEKKFKYTLKQKCHVCKKAVNKGMIHDKCKAESFLDGVFIIAKYDKFIENYIADIKYEFYYAMIPDLVKVMNKYLERNKKFKKIIAQSDVTYVPLHFWRKRWRGFNQAERIASGIAEEWGSKCKRLLKRKRNTKCQVGLKKKERLNNLKDAFECKYSGNVKRSVVIIDDVMTTGSTLEECGKALKDADIEKVYGLVAARG
jgi:ComF family protein